MSDKFTLDVVLAAELKYAFERNGWSLADVKAMTGGDMAHRLLQIVRGLAEVTVIQHIIDCDADPSVPYENWKVVEHRKGGQLVWDLSKLALGVAGNQIDGVSGHELRKKLSGTRAINANALDYLLKNPRLIPDEWKKNVLGKTCYICFWGTIYSDPDRGLCIRCLYCGEGEVWQEDQYCLNWPFDTQYSALEHAS